MSWHVVFGDPDLAGGPDRPSPAAALAAAPELAWPLHLVAGDGSTTTVAAALGRGGDAVERLLDRVVTPPPGLEPAGLSALAAATPAGPVALPVAEVDLAAAVSASMGVERSWLAEVDGVRARARRRLHDEGRATELEAALHASMLLGTCHLGRGDDGLDRRVASGALLWLLGGAVAWALAATGADPFSPWAELVVHRWWPVGPVAGRLVVTRLGHSRPRAP